MMSALNAFNDQFISKNQRYALEQIKIITDSLNRAGLQNSFSMAASKSNRDLDCVMVTSYKTDNGWFTKSSSPVETQAYVGREVPRGEIRELEHSEIDANIVRSFGFVLDQQERELYQRYLSNLPQP